MKTKYSDGTTGYHFRDSAGKVFAGDRKTVGAHNAKVVSDARNMYKQNTNTRLDRGLSKVVNAGDKVKDTASKATNKLKNAPSKAKDTASKAANKIKNAPSKAKYNINEYLDKKKPIYEQVTRYGPEKATTTNFTDAYGNVGKMTTYSRQKYYETVQRKRNFR